LTAQYLMNTLLIACKNSLGEEHPDIYPVLAKLRGVCYCQSQHEKATTVAQQILALQERTLGPDHPALIDILKRLGDMAREEDDFQGTEPYIRRAIHIAEQLPE